MPSIIRLIDAGMSIARFNMSHGNPKVSQQAACKMLDDISLEMCKNFSLGAGAHLNNRESSGVIDSECLLLRIMLA